MVICIILLTVLDPASATPSSEYTTSLRGCKTARPSLSPPRLSQPSQRLITILTPGESRDVEAWVVENLIYTYIPYIVCVNEVRGCGLRAYGRKAPRASCKMGRPKCSSRITSSMRNSGSRG